MCGANMRPRLCEPTWQKCVNFFLALHLLQSTKATREGALPSTRCSRTWDSCVSRLQMLKSGARFAICMFLFSESLRRHATVPAGNSFFFFFKFILFHFSNLLWRGAKKKMPVSQKVEKECAVQSLACLGKDRQIKGTRTHLLLLKLDALDLGRAGVVPLLISMPLANAGCDARKHIVFVPASRAPASTGWTNR